MVTASIRPRGMQTHSDMSDCRAVLFRHVSMKGGHTRIILARLILSSEASRN